MKLEAAMNKWILKINNLLVGWRRIRVRPEEILLLLPHCLHKQSCSQNVIHSLDECKRCGACTLGALSGIRDECKVAAFVAGGGRQALSLAKQPGIKAVVAVACEKELVQGILAAFPKPVLGVTNITPEGFCKNTLADPDKVRKAIASLTASP